MFPVKNTGRNHCLIYTPLSAAATKVLKKHLKLWYQILALPLLLRWTEHPSTAMRCLIEQHCPQYLVTGIPRESQQHISMATTKLH